MPIELEKSRCLNLAEPISQGQAKYISAASGIARIGSHFFVVADDETVLGMFSQDPESPGIVYRLLEENLPSEQKARKKVKPDFEALLFLNKALCSPFGGLLAIPSGSTANRMTGSLIKFSNTENIFEKVTAIDFRGFFGDLSSNISDLNIEGAVICGIELKLFQRGNGASRQNMVISCELASTIGSLEKRLEFKPSTFDLKPVTLGLFDGCPLSFTDAACEDPEKVWFLAAAEASDNTYDDGQFKGAVLGCMNPSGEVTFLDELVCPAKPEGLCIDGTSNPSRFYVVTDADDPRLPAYLYQGELPAI